jgi:hypothetical protein
MNITAKIWLSIGVFVLGFVLSTVLGQVQGLSTEATMRTTSDALFPAAQRSQEAEASFQRMAKGFSDAVLIQDALALRNAADEGTHAIEELRAVADSHEWSLGDLTIRQSLGNLPRRQPLPLHSSHQRRREGSHPIHSARPDTAVLQRRLEDTL